MRRTLARSAVAALLLLGGVPAHALGLGPASVRSDLTAALRAEIPITGLTQSGVDPDAVRVDVPGFNEHARLGFAEPIVPADLSFDLERDADGGARLRLSTARAVREPVLRFVVRATWPGGSTVREYTLLLDLPSFARPARADAVAIGEPARPAHPAATQTLHGDPFRPPAPAQAGTRYGPVALGDTLHAILASAYPARVDDALMQAIVARNPHAFAGGDPGRLLLGATLELPAAATLASRPASRGDLAPAAEAPPAAAATYRVQPGDTLYRIARTLAGSGSAPLGAVVQQLFERNPHAFIEGDIDRLRAGASLSLDGVPRAGAAASAQSTPVTGAATSAQPAPATGAAASAQPAPTTSTAASAQPAPTTSTAASAQPAPATGAAASAQPAPATGATASAQSAPATGAAADPGAAQQVEDLQLALGTAQRAVATELERQDSLRERLAQTEREIASLRERDAALSAATETLRERLAAAATAAAAAPPAPAIAGAAGTPDAATPAPVPAAPPQPAAPPTATTPATAATAPAPTSTPAAAPAAAVTPPVVAPTVPAWSSMPASTWLAAGIGAIALLALLAVRARRSRSRRAAAQAADPARNGDEEATRRRLAEVRDAHANRASAAPADSAPGKIAALADVRTTDGARASALAKEAAVHLAYGDHRAAHTSIVKAIKLAPHQDEHKMMLMTVYQAMGRHDQARAIVDDLLNRREHLSKEVRAQVEQLA